MTPAPLHPDAIRGAGWRRDVLREVAESDHIAPVLRYEAGDGHAATYAYRGYDFTITRVHVGWWCHEGVGRKGDLTALCHEAGWFTWTRRGIVRKLGRAVDRELRTEGRRVCG